MSAGAKIRDTAVITGAMQALQAGGEEFPIKVEGTKTLPYSAVLVAFEAGSGELLIKLFRPLPPALAEGALFEMVFATQDKRYEGRISLLGRAEYLHYRFQVPAFLVASDRRVWKRYPFRPRENYHVTAQDADIPGHGMTGVLLDLSMGGLAFRLERMVQLEDGLPVLPRPHHFESGMPLSMLRIRGLGKGELITSRGLAVRATEIEGALKVGVQFQGMADADRAALARLLEARERQSTGNTGRNEGTVRLTWPAGAPATLDGELAEDEDAAAAEVPAGPEAAGRAILRTLDRRCSRVLVVCPAGAHRGNLTARLANAGFPRVEAVADLFEAHAAWKEAGEAKVRLLVVDLEASRAEGLEPVGAVRHLEPLLKSFGEVPVAFTTQAPDPLLELLDRPGLGALALEPADGPDWAPVLDHLLAI